jgi:pyruvate/2-oxoglutarate dehydrogenase complex dihydrolipoamide dehydrogenase (E3) component
LNWGYRVALRDKKVTYLNAYGTFVDAHTIRTVNKKNEESIITAKNVVIATGGKRSYSPHIAPTLSAPPRSLASAAHAQAARACRTFPAPASTASAATTSSPWTRPRAAPW